MLRRCVTWPLCSQSFCSCCLERETGLSLNDYDGMAGAKPRVLIYLLRRDVRLSDNPVFHAASTYPSMRVSNERSAQNSDTRNQEDPLISQHEVPAFTHLLPVYVFPAHQVEVSGFLPSPTDHSPYPQARSRVARVWRTGPHRAKFMAEGVWDLKERLESLECESGLEVRAGMIGEVVENMLEWYAGDASGRRAEVAGIWITGEEGTEEKDDEADLKRIAEKRGVEFKVWQDDKYYIDECVLPSLLRGSRGNFS